MCFIQCNNCYCNIPVAYMFTQTEILQLDVVWLYDSYDKLFPSAIDAPLLRINPASGIIRNARKPCALNILSWQTLQSMPLCTLMDDKEDKKELIQKY